MTNAHYYSTQDDAMAALDFVQINNDIHMNEACTSQSLVSLSYWLHTFSTGLEVAKLSNDFEMAIYTCSYTM